MEGCIDIERYLEESIVRGLRTLFAADTDYTIIPENLKSSAINITSSKPRDPDLSKPHIYLNGMSYSISDLGLNKGFSNDIINNKGRSGEERVYDVRFSTALVVSSTNNSTSKNLTNRVVDWMWIRGREFMEENLKIKINGLRKNQGGKIRLSENDEFFSETIQLEGSAIVKTTIYDLDLTGILEKVILYWVD